MSLHTFLTLLKRESWEHRSLVWLPLLTAALIVVTALISTQVAGSIRISLDGGERDFFATLSLDPQAQAQLFGVWMGSLVAPIMLVAAVVLFFYLLDALYAERKDRSILFWKSLPVSDAATVISKAVTALIAVPIWVWLLSLVTGLLTFVIVAIKVSGTPMAPLGNFHFAAWGVLQLTLLQNLLIAALWYAPLAAWLLLVSVWARHAPFLWAVLPPALLALFEEITFGSSQVFKFIGYRLVGFFDAIGPGLVRDDADEADTATILQSIRDAYEGMSAVSLLGTPDLYLGVLAAVALLALAIRLRRWRDDA
jgi:ABC-2 type transport system permease protein